MRRIVKLSLACLTVGLASACKTAELVHPTGFQPVGGVRFINAVPDSSGAFGMNFHFVDIVENSFQYHMTFRNAPSSASPFISGLTEYKGTLNGSRHFRLFLDDTITAVATTVLADTTVTVVAGHNYTAIEWGAGRLAAPNNMRMAFWEEKPADPGANVSLGFINATNAAVDVRVYLAPQSLVTAAATPVTWTVPAYDTSASPTRYVTLAPGSYFYNVVPAGAAVTVANELVADGATMTGSLANCDGLPCATGQKADIDANAGATVPGSAITAVLFPKVFLAEVAPGAPTATLAAAGAGKIGNGPHVYRVTFVTKAGSAATLNCSAVPCGETNGGTVSASVTIVDSTVNGQIQLTNIPVGVANPGNPLDPTVKAVARNVYRLTGKGYQLLTTLADNTTTTFLDNVPDASLGAQLAPGVNTTIRTPQGAAFTAGAQLLFMWDKRPPRTCDPYC
jgi:hypothetical protein